MEFNELMKLNKDMFDKWLNDKDIRNNYEIEDLQKEFLECVQLSIGSNLVIRTKSQDIESMEKYYNQKYWNFDC